MGLIRYFSVILRSCLVSHLGTIVIPNLFARVCDFTNATKSTLLNSKADFLIGNVSKNSVGFINSLTPSKYQIIII